MLLPGFDRAGLLAPKSDLRLGPTAQDRSVEALILDDSATPAEPRGDEVLFTAGRAFERQSC